MTTSAGASAWTFPPEASLGTKDPLDTAINYDGSTGGGVSAVYTQPWYQKAIVPTALAKTEVVSTPVFVKTSTGPTLEGFNESIATAKNPMRVIPDVSALADPSTGTAVGETLFGPNNSPLKFSISRIGGTSLASPIFAGIEADAQQAHGKAIGFANPAIYNLDARNGTTNAFHDVTDTPGGVQRYEVRSNYTNPYNATLPLVTYLRFLGVNGADGSITFPVSTSPTTTTNLTLQLASALQATSGYDDETGVGSPDNYIVAFK
jgi:subtilase family serine protease